MVNKNPGLLTLEESIRLAMKVDCWGYSTSRFEACDEDEIESQEVYRGVLERLGFEIRRIETGKNMGKKEEPKKELYLFLVYYSETVAEVEVLAKGGKIKLFQNKGIGTNSPLDGFDLAIFKSNDNPQLGRLFDYLETQRKVSKLGDRCREFQIREPPEDPKESGLYYARKFL